MNISFGPQAQAKCVTIAGRKCHAQHNRVICDNGYYKRRRSSSSNGVGCCGSKRQWGIQSVRHWGSVVGSRKYAVQEGNQLRAKQRKLHLRKWIACKWANGGRGSSGSSSCGKQRAGAGAMQNKTTSQPENKQLSSVAAAWQVARWRAEKPQTGDKMVLQNIVVAVVVSCCCCHCRCCWFCCCCCCCWQRAINFPWKNFVHLIFSNFNDILMRFENKRQSKPHSPTHTHTHTFSHSLTLFYAQSHTHTHPA